MKKTIIAAVAAGALFALPAMAQAQVYGNIGYTSVDVEDASVKLGMVQARVGYDVSPNFAIEGEAGIGVKDDSIGGVNVELKHQIGVFAVGKANVTENFDFIARAGYVTAEVEASAAGVSASDSTSDFAFGLGVQGFVTENDGVRAEWTNYGGDANVWSIAYVRRF